MENQKGSFNPHNVLEERYDSKIFRRCIMFRWDPKLFVFFILMLCLVHPVQSDPVRVRPDQNFTLHVGQRAKLNDAFTIIFKSVLKDSRCPVNVTCVWAGNGKVELEILESNENRKTVKLNTTIEPKIKSINKYLLQLILLSPPKVDGVNIGPEEYSVTLRIIANK